MGFKTNANPDLYFYLNLPFINMYFPYLISNTLKIDIARVLEKKKSFETTYPNNPDCTNTVSTVILLFWDASDIKPYLLPQLSLIKRDIFQRISCKTF